MKDVTLIVSEPTDALARRVELLAPTAIRCTEVELLDDARFAVSFDQTAVSGFFSFRGQEVPLAAISGVLYRPVARWQSPKHISVASRGFASHEIRAAWCAILNGLSCPVLNRPSPETWIDESLQRAILEREVATQLNLGLAEDGGDRRTPAGRLRAGHFSLYLVDHDLVEPPGTPDDLVRLLRSRVGSLRAWQYSAGVRFARLDFVAMRVSYRFARLELFPRSIRPARTFEEVSRAVAAMLVPSP